MGLLAVDMGGLDTD